jgi:hypothetical protein
MDGASSALRYATTIFSSGKSQVVAQHPEQRSGRFYINVYGSLVDPEGDHRTPPLARKNAADEESETQILRFATKEGKFAARGLDLESALAEI